MRPSLTRTDVTAAAALCGVATLVIVAWLADAAGLRFLPWPMLAAGLAGAGACRLALHPRATRARETAWLASGVGAASALWLLWLARPSLLPLATGPDLTHHLVLIRHIEEHWRLVHDPALERFLGEMAQYTPGSHILAALGGAWSGTDGTRALHPVLALLVALKTVFLILIAVRLLPDAAPRPLALAGVLLVLAAPRYALGEFAEYGFVAQVVAEVFAVGMWWALTLWDGSPDWRIALVFSVAGAAAFLTWPVYVGPPVAAFGLAVLLREGLRVRERAWHLLAGLGPFALGAGAYLLPRLGWLQMAGTGGDAPWPSASLYSWPLTVLAATGLVCAVARRRGRLTALVTLMTLAQAAALYVLAVRRGTGAQPYMAEKMAYLLLWPMAACAVAVMGEAWEAGRRMHWPRAAARVAPRALAWAMVGITALGVALPLAVWPKRLRPLPPALVSVDLYDAGRWARANLQASCIEYLVADDETSYWLHLAVLGNPRMSARTADWSTYEPKDAIYRWLTPGGLPYAIADLATLPRGVRDELEVTRRFGTAAIVRRRGPASCDSTP